MTLASKTLKTFSSLHKANRGSLPPIPVVARWAIVLQRVGKNRCSRALAFILSHAKK